MGLASVNIKITLKQFLVSITFALFQRLTFSTAASSYLPSSVPETVTPALLSPEMSQERREDSCLPHFLSLCFFSFSKHLL